MEEVKENMKIRIFFDIDKTGYLYHGGFKTEHGSNMISKLDTMKRYFVDVEVPHESDAIPVSHKSEVNES